jgi:hypothetical protein
LDKELRRSLDTNEQRFESLQLVIVGNDNPIAGHARKAIPGGAANVFEVSRQRVSRPRDRSRARLWWEAGCLNSLRSSGARVRHAGLVKPYVRVRTR